MIYKLIILFIFLLIVFLYYSKKTKKKSIVKKIQGGFKSNCRLSEVIKHNLNDNKWVYINGTIYDVTSIINLDALSIPDVFKNINMKNVNTFVNLLKYTDLQDLHKIFKSYESFNTYVNEYNLNENNKVKLDTFDYETLISTEDTIKQITNKFSNFKLLLFIALEQFNVGTICPGGLRI